MSWFDLPSWLVITIVIGLVLLAVYQLSPRREIEKEQFQTELGQAKYARIAADRDVEFADATDKPVDIARDELKVRTRGGVDNDLYRERKKIDVGGELDLEGGKADIHIKTLIKEDEAVLQADKAAYAWEEEKRARAEARREQSAASETVRQKPRGQAKPSRNGGDNRKASDRFRK